LEYLANSSKLKNHSYKVLIRILGNIKMPDEKTKKEWDEKVLADLKKKRDTQCVVSGISYDNVMKLQDVLRKKGIDCNVIAGGFAIYANYQDPRVISACKQFKTVASAGTANE
jgi:hypothetical protein